MYRAGLREDFNLLDFFKLFKFKWNFRREHPYWFDPIGTMIFCGSQGKGKTLSAVNYVYNILNRYPNCILVTNVAMREYPFNAFYHHDEASGKSYVVDMESKKEITSDDMLNGIYKHVVIEYDGLDTLKFIENGEYGVVYLIDELHLELNSLESKNIDIDVMTEISQQRKQRKHIIGTSQVYMRLAKPLREQIFNVVLCNNFFGCVQFNKLIDGEQSYERDGKLEAKVISRYLWTHSPDMYGRYDTYAKMRRYKKEWQGHKRDTPMVTTTRVEVKTK